MVQDIPWFRTSRGPGYPMEKWWTRLKQSYEGRPFHNLDHLYEMLNLFDEYKDKLRDRYATAIAIFFLHAVNDPKATDNAERSARLLREFSSETTFDSENYVANLIVESGKNCTEAHMTEGMFGEDDLHFLLDFDMAFLGSESAKYDVHLANIRKEYAHLSDEDYADQRLKVLKLFMQIPNIFATKELRERFEAKARENIAHEITTLSKR
ncbi:unnamed protein product [Toxocara canis]|uniref:TerB domain-containing protein n=1 Tax=Toxocara canis TaxID=6265 RepID=A0A183VA04_TOXCA|nr:unnamed protein product [Toxocara canis]